MLAFPLVAGSVLRAHSLDVDCGRHGCSNPKSYPMGSWTAHVDGSCVCQNALIKLSTWSDPGQGSCQPLAIAASQSSHASSGKVRCTLHQSLGMRSAFASASQGARVSITTA
ncbi:hypothetical protein KCU92_g198, partial [Aureobasidium melanogenum]